MAGDEATQDQLDRLAAAALEHYDLSPDATATLINVSENWTYRIDDPATGRSAALRVHRPGYHDAGEIESELAWLEALRAGRRHRDASRRAHARRARGCTRCRSTASRPAQRRAVRVARRGGADGRGRAVVPAPRRRLRAHARALARAGRGRRRSRASRWDYATTLGANGHWGRWQDGLGMAPRTPSRC